MRKQRIEIYRGLGGYGTLGLEIVISVLIGLFGGRWLDERFGTEPWLGVLGFALGVGAAVRSVQRTQRDLRRVAEKEEREQGNPAPVYGTERDRLEQIEARKLRLERMLIDKTALEAELVAEAEAEAKARADAEAQAKGGDGPEERAEAGERDR
jgi:ATP synthase protein I